jgi:hypothetical protein
MNLLDSYRDAVKRSNKLSAEESSINITKEREKADLEYLYRDKIYAIEKERDQAISTIEDTANEKLQNLKQEKLQYSSTISQVKTLLKLMGIIKNPDIQNTSPEVYYYSDRDANGNYCNPKIAVSIEPIKTLLENMYSTIKLYVVPNGKPKNKYSLVIRGYNIFGSDLIPNFGGYINRINGPSCNLKYTVKDADNEHDLIMYANDPKNMTKIMNLLPTEQLKNLGEQYDQAMILLKDIQWQILYLGEQKYYYEHNYSNGTNTPEYAKVLKDLKLLKKQ